MNNNEKGIICLLKSAILGVSESLPEGFELEQAIRILAKHSVLPLGFVGARQCGISMQEPVMQQLFLHYRKATVYSNYQIKLIEQIFEAFEENGIDYMPVKGCNMKKRYPSPELRYMGDADILIRLEQYPAIRSIMNQLGFEEGKESDHELIWTAKDMMIELHKRLIPSYNKDFIAYYGDGWQLGKLHEGHRYYMSPEDEYIYLFTHFAKHYRDGGIGIRHLLDLWIYQREYPEMDHAYIQSVLSQMKLNEFFENLQRVINAWFCGGSWDEKTEFISEVILRSGDWGKRSVHDLSASVKWRQTKSYANRFKRFRRLVLPTAEELSYNYPVLKTQSYLLPLLWCRRVFELLFFRREKLLYQLKTVPEQVNEHEQALKYVGLGYHFHA